MNARLSFMLFIAAAALLVGTVVAAQPPSSERETSILVLSSSEDAGGTTQAEFGPEVLKMLEQRSVELLKSKTRAYLKSQGQPTELPALRSESHYIQANGVKLAIVRITAPRSINQVFVYGIRGTELHRVACVRTKHFSESVPLFYGPCSERIREIFGVSINPS